MDFMGKLARLLRWFQGFWHLSIAVNQFRHCFHFNNHNSFTLSEHVTKLFSCIAHGIYMHLNSLTGESSTISTDTKVFANAFFSDF